MKYAILVLETEAEFVTRTDPDPSRRAAYWGAWQAYTAAMSEAGVLCGGEPLEPPYTATTIRLREGERAVEDGPFADSKEQLAGFYLIDVSDLDEAMVWGARCPSSGVEIRPIAILR